MQTIVNLVWGGIGVAWVPQSVAHFRREGVVYRHAGEILADAPDQAGGAAPCAALPACETSLVWQAQSANPAMARFVDFVRGRRPASVPGAATYFYQ